MDKQEQRGLYQVTWTDSNGEMKEIHLLSAESAKYADGKTPDLRRRNWEKSISRVDDGRVKSLLDLMGWTGSKETTDIHIWLHVEKRGEYNP